MGASRPGGRSNRIGQDCLRCSLHVALVVWMEWLDVVTGRLCGRGGCRCGCDAKEADGGWRWPMADGQGPRMLAVVQMAFNAAAGECLLSLSLSVSLSLSLSLSVCLSIFQIAGSARLMMQQMVVEAGLWKEGSRCD